MSRLSSKPLAVLFSVNLLNFYDRAVPGALTEPIRLQFHLTDTQVGLLGTAFTLVYALLGLPLGRLADRVSRRKLLAAGVALWSALTALAGVASSFTDLLLSRLGVGVGEATCAPISASWIGDLYKASERSRSLAIFMTAVPLGNALANFICGPFGEAYGWRAPMISAALPAVLLVPLLLSLPEPPRGQIEADEAASLSEQRAEPSSGAFITQEDRGLEAGIQPEPRSEASSVWRIVRIRTLWWITGSGALINFVLYALAIFFPAFLIRVHHLSLGQAGIASGLGTGLFGVAGGLAAGYWGDRIYRKRRDGRMLSAAGWALLAAPFSFFGIVLPAGHGCSAAVLISLAYGLLSGYYALVYSSILDVVPARLRGTAMAAYFLAMYLCGASFGPLLTGSLSDRLALRSSRAAGVAVVNETFRAVGLHQAMYVIPLLSLALAAVLFAGSRTIERDMARV